MDTLISVRKALHQRAELSGQEEKTAAYVQQLLADCQPDHLLTGLGGHGLAAIFEGKNEGPGILLRADLDALPIPETLDMAHGSGTPDVAHKCGHDGHMTILIGVARRLAERRPPRGQVILLFQPAEEIGQGARWVLDDPTFQDIQPDYVFALHNLPGFETGAVVLRRQTFASASKGMIIRLTGATSHASQPESGHSPALAVAQLIQSLSAVPQFHSGLSQAAQVTIIHAKIGEQAFGTSPGKGVVMATLRSHEQAVMETVTTHCERIANAIAATYNLDCEIEYVEEFPATVNDGQAVAWVEQAAHDLKFEQVWPETPFPWSEDFGHFTAGWPGALFGLGAGIDTPALHHPTYDFPDELLAPGVEMFVKLIDIVTAEV